MQRPSDAGPAEFMTADDFTMRENFRLRTVAKTAADLLQHATDAARYADKDTRDLQDLRSALRGLAETFARAALHVLERA